MATVVETRTTRATDPEHRFVLRGVGWAGYEALLEMVGDGHVRLTCDGEDVELMSPSRSHDAYAELIGRIVNTVTEELDIPCQGLRTTTWRKKAKEKGLEADNCYYLSSLPRIEHKWGDLDLNVDPPPDLAIEIEISRSALDRMAIYAALGVPEVWRFDGENLVIERLQPDGHYARIPESLSLAILPPDEVARWLRLGGETGNQTKWNRQLRVWVRAELLPRYEGR